MQLAKDKESIILPALLSVLILVAWHLGVKVSKTNIFPTPVSVWYGLIELLKKGLLLSGSNPVECLQ